MQGCEQFIESHFDEAYQFIVSMYSSYIAILSLRNAIQSLGCFYYFIILGMSFALKYFLIEICNYCQWCSELFILFFYYLEANLSINEIINEYKLYWLEWVIWNTLKKM